MTPHQIEELASKIEHRVIVGIFNWDLGSVIEGSKWRLFAKHMASELAELAATEMEDASEPK